MVKLIPVIAILTAALCLWFAFRDPPVGANVGVTVTVTEPDPAPASAPAVSLTPTSKKTDLAFKSAENTMSAQLDLLARNDIAGFRATFSIPVTDEQFALCKKRMTNAHLSPDWEMAKHTTENGQHVTKVSIFGKGMTAFREVNGR